MANSQVDSVERRLLRIIGKDADIKEENCETDLFNTNLETILLNTIDNTQIWLQRALSDFNFKFSFVELKEGSNVFADKARKGIIKAGVEKGVGDLIDAYLDVRQNRLGSFKRQSFIKKNMQSPDSKNWKYFVKLFYILRKLGINDKREMRMYIKGVDDKKCLGTVNTNNIIPIKILSSPYCVLDFIIYLKENWYARHTGHSGVKWEPEYRERDFGQSHYLRLANQALGFLKDTLHSNRGSIFSSEIPASLGMGAENEEFFAYYILACSKITQEFWKRGWLHELNPKIDAKVNMLKSECESNRELEKVLRFANKCADTLWEKYRLPMYGENDDFSIMWISDGKPRLEQEIREWISA